MKTLASAVLSCAVALPIAAQDTIIVRADNAPVWGQAELVEELRIGTLAGDERYSFGLVVGVLETPDGTVWVADRMLDGIRRYSADGSYLDQLGRDGRGPGEFRYIMDIRATPSGEVAVWDPMASRVTFFSQDGSVTGSTTIPVGGVTGGEPQPFEVDSAGQLYAVWQDTRRFWLQVAQTGEVIDTIWYPGSDRVGIVNPTRTMPALSPVYGVVIGRNDEMSFTWSLPDGRSMRITRAVEPVEYGRAERAQAQAREDVVAERWGDPPRTVPREKPIWSEFEVDGDGRIWVRRHVEAVRVEETEAERERREGIGNPPWEWVEPTVYDVIDQDGTFLGTVRFPNSTWASVLDRVELVHAQGDTVWVVEKGEFGEDYVVKYRIMTDGG